MNIFRFQPRKISTMVFDLCGTLIDKYSRAPVVAMRNVFSDSGIKVNNREISKYMGNDKKRHIRSILNDPIVRQINRNPPIVTSIIKGQKRVNISKQADEKLVDDLYHKYKLEQMKVLPIFCKPIEGVEETLHLLKEENPDIKLGVDTGFPRVVLNDILRNFQLKGIKLPIDNYVASDDVPRPRPYPDSIWKNMLDLNSKHPLSVIKVGDTPIDIKAGLNAGVISIGVCDSSSYMGELLEEMEIVGDSLNDVNKGGEIYKTIVEKVRNKLNKEKPYYVLNSITELPSIVEYLNSIANTEGGENLMTDGKDFFHQK